MGYTGGSEANPLFVIAGPDPAIQSIKLNAGSPGCPWRSWWSRHDGKRNGRAGWGWGDGLPGQV